MRHKNNEGQSINESFVLRRSEGLVFDNSVTGRRCVRHVVPEINCADPAPSPTGEPYSVGDEVLITGVLEHGLHDIVAVAEPGHMLILRRRNERKKSKTTPS